MKIYDVRTNEEFNNGHADGAESLPLSDIESGILPEVDKSSPIAVYCYSGGRAARAKELLEEAGFADVQNLGGVGDLDQHNLVIVK